MSQAFIIVQIGREDTTYCGSDSSDLDRLFSNADGCKRLDKEEGTINPIIPRESENRCMT